MSSQSAYSAAPPLASAPSTAPARTPSAGAVGGAASTRVPIPVVRPRDGVDRIACSFNYRRSAEVGFEPKDRRLVVLQRAGDESDFRLGEFELSVDYRRSKRGGGALSIIASTPPFEVTDAYDFGSATVAAQLPRAGHGFTGLRYVHTAGSPGELQYYCGAHDPGEDLSQEAASQTHPGPEAPAGSVVECHASVTDRDGTVLHHETLVIVPENNRPSRMQFEGFALTGSYIVGEYDSGGLYLDASAKGADIRDAYQSMGHALPSNLLSEAKFLGARELIDRATGRALRYSCATVADHEIASSPASRALAADCSFFPRANELSVGMSFAQVQAILGPPTSKAPDGSWAEWYRDSPKHVNPYLRLAFHDAHLSQLSCGLR